VLDAVVQHLVVDFVGVDDQVMLARERDDLLQDLVRVYRAGRIVRVDHHDRARVGVDLRAHVLDVRQPALVLVAQVVHRPAAR